MIPTARGFIYSPKHHTEYTKEIAGRTEGVGLWVEDDIAAWNFAWLSFPQLDLYLRPDTTHESIIATIDARLLGTVIGMAQKTSAKVYPGLRSALFAHPNKLRQVLDVLDLAHTPAGKLGSQEWVDTVYQRLSTLALGSMPLVVGNVVYHDFAARRKDKR